MPQNTEHSIYDDVGIYQALEDFSGEESDEVSYSKGEELQVIESNLDGWWKVRTSQNKEGYTPALNLEKHSNEKSSMNEFARKSANTKGLPPRKSFNKDDDSFPVYAKVNKLKKKNKINKEESMEDKTEDQPPKSGYKVEYTEVYIGKGDSNGNVGKPILRRQQTPVEYSDIVPLKLPNDDKRPKSDTPKFKIEETTKPKKSSSLETNIDNEKEGSHLYENVSGTAFKKDQGKASPAVPRCPLPTPRNKDARHSYDNVLPTQETTGSPVSPKPREQRNTNEYDNALPHKKSPTDKVEKENDESLDSSVTSGDFDLPSMPSLPSPKLPKDFKLPSPSSTVSDKQCPPQYIGAICDYCAPRDGDHVLSFKTGDHGVLLKRGNEGWWGVKIRKQKGWVPAAYWHILEERPPVPQRKSSTESNSTSSTESSPKMRRKPARIERVRTPPSDDETKKEESKVPSDGKRKVHRSAEVDFRTQPWFMGMITRQESEMLLLHNGRQCDFLVRESTNRVGDFTLSVTYHSRVRHFPIQNTGENRFYIGKHNFKNLNKVIHYYKQHPLFFDENTVPVSLGNPVIH